ncbi:MAG: alpha-amylase family glycosyl hydrolase, partial [Bacillota bacterium]
EQHDDNPPNYECWWGFGHLPKLNAENPEVQDYIFEVTEKWLDPKGNGDLNAGIDGWRLDVPNEIKDSVPDFWVRWRQFVKEINPEAYIVGEIWDDATDYLQGDEFDGVMNYRFRDAVLRFIGLNEISAAEFRKELNKLYIEYPQQANYALLNLIGSHDTSRYLTLIDEDQKRLKLTALFQMTYLGAPMIYYGDEIGMKGEDGPDCRRTMIWEDRGYTKPDEDLFSHYQHLIKLRDQEAALCRGTIEQISLADQELTAFKRSYQGDEVLVIINVSEEENAITLELFQSDGYYQDLYNKSEVEIRDNQLELQLAGVSGAVIKLGGTD